MLRGVRPEAVIGAIKARQQGTLEPGRKLGLVIEGGAMRGVVSAGALTALEELGLTHVFDEVYGCSGGAINAAYFLAGQAAYGTSIYYQDVNNRRFINFWRFWKIVDVDYIFDTVLPSLKPLRVADALAAPSRLFIAITDADTGEGFLVEVQKNDFPLLTLLKASTALPVLYNRRIDVAGRSCCDGGFVNPIPIEDAIANGCTDLLVLLTRPVSYREPPPRLLQRAFFWGAGGGRNPRFARAFLEIHRRANALRDLAHGRRPSGRAVNILTICPEDGDVLVERTTTDTATLKAAAAQSMSAMLRALGQDRRAIVEVLRSFQL